MSWKAWLIALIAAGVLMIVFPGRFILQESARSAENDRRESLLFFGDAMFGRRVGEKIANGMDPFEFINAKQATSSGNATSTLFSSYDLVVLNLEGPITASTTKCQNKAYSFRFEPETAGLLAQNGISAVNLANNHTFDCYANGLRDTREYLEKANELFFGGATTTERFVEREVGGKIIALVGIDLTIDHIFYPEYAALIKMLKQKGDTVIVEIHWGEEYRAEPTSFQKQIGRGLVDAGADAVIGHHPHVVEPVTIYKDRPIFYSLGNFIFDQIGAERNTGIGVGLIFHDRASSTARIYPFNIDKMRPKLMDDAASQKYCLSFLRNIPSSRGCSFVF